MSQHSPISAVAIKQLIQEAGFSGKGPLAAAGKNIGPADGAPKTLRKRGLENSLAAVLLRALLIAPSRKHGLTASLVPSNARFCVSPNLAQAAESVGMTSPCAGCVLSKIGSQAR